MTVKSDQEPLEGGLEELSREIRKVIEDNRKFLERVMDEEFEDEELPEGDDPEEEL